MSSQPVRCRRRQVRGEDFCEQLRDQRVLRDTWLD
jgi:hypothetical protein